MLGTGLPGAVGLKAAHPDRVVFGFSGDGGSISTIQAISTAARHSLGVKFVVCNNRSYRILKLNLQDYWMKRVLANPVRFLSASTLPSRNCVSIYWPKHRECAGSAWRSPMESFPQLKQPG